MGRVWNVCAGVCVLIASSLLLVAWKNQRHEALKPENGAIRVAVKDLADGKPHYFKTSVDGKEVRFFLLISNDGVVRAALDACDVCYPAKKGYSHEGDFVICNNCGRRFHESRINLVQGGCNPAPLGRSYDETNVTISLKDIARGAAYF